MATKKSVDARRQIAGQILHTPKAEGRISVEDYNNLLVSAKKLAGSILSTKQEKTGLLGRLVGSRN